MPLAALPQPSVRCFKSKCNHNVFVIDWKAWCQRELDRELTSKTIKLYTDGAQTKQGKNKKIAAAAVFYHNVDYCEFGQLIKNSKSNQNTPKVSANTAELYALLQALILAKKRLKQLLEAKVDI